MNFDLTEDQKLIQQTARDFARDHISPFALAWDRDHGFPPEILDKMAELGLLGMYLPEEYGGGGVDAISYTLALMEISRGCSSIGVTMSVNHLACDCVHLFGDEAQKKKYLTPLASGKMVGAFCLTEPEAGSDAQNQKTRAKAVEGGYLLTGKKTFITNGGFAGVYIITAVTSGDGDKKEIGAFILEKGARGLVIGKPEHKMGQCASNTVELTLEEAFVPKANLIGGENGFKVMMKGLNGGRIGIAALCCGIATACLELSLAYASERRAFGKPIAELQAIQFKVAEMATRLESARLMTLQAAFLKDRGRPFVKEASMAKYWASEVCNLVAAEAVQIHGGYGYIREYEVEKLFRDARVTTIYEGTSEIQKMVIARQLLAKFQKRSG